MLALVVPLPGPLGATMVSQRCSCDILLCQTGRCGLRLRGVRRRIRGSRTTGGHSWIARQSRKWVSRTVVCAVFDENHRTNFVFSFPGSVTREQNFASLWCCAAVVDRKYYVFYQDITHQKHSSRLFSRRCDGSFRPVRSGEAIGARECTRHLRHIRSSSVQICRSHGDCQWTVYQALESDRCSREMVCECEQKLFVCICSKMTPKWSFCGSFVCQVVTCTFVIPFRSTSKKQPKVINVQSISKDCRQQIGLR